MVFLFVISRVCFFKNEFVHHVVQLVHQALPGSQGEKQKASGEDTCVLGRLGCCVIFFWIDVMVHSSTKHVKVFLRSRIGSEWCLTVLTW